MTIQRIWARGFPLFLSILFLTLLSACNLGATDEQQINVTDLPQQTQNALLASPSPNQPTRTPSGFNLPTPQIVATAQLPPTLSFRPPLPILPTLTALPVNVFILSPIPGNIVAGNVQVIGAAMHPEFLQYQLEYGPDPNPSNLWYPITGGVQSPVFNGLLGIWNTNTANTPDGVYQLRLRVFLRNGVDWGNVVVNNIRVQNRIPTPVPTSTQAARPIAAFTQDKVTGTAPLTVNFINLSSPTNLITGFTWNFGDGTTSTEISPIKTFNNPGQYTVLLTATGPGGSSNVSRQITVQSANPPVAGFTTDKTSGSAPLTVQFTDASTGGQVSNYLWNFSDGTTSTQRNPSHQFTNVGTYNVILTVSGPGGVSNATRQITVGNPIQASIAAVADANNYLKINLTATVSGGSGTYTAYDWDFGNGQTLFGQSTPTTSVTYASANTYTVTLTVTDSTGAKKSVTQPITIQAPPPPLAGDFTIAQTNPTDLAVNFSATGTGGSGTYTYSWNFGDTGTGTGQTPSHTYAGAGTYNVQLTVNDGTNNVTVTKTVTITAVVPTLAGDFTISQASPTDLNIGVSATATGGTGSYTYSWNFGDTGTGSGQVTTHTYATAGTYTITLTISDGTNTVNVVKDVTVNAVPPLAGDFTVTQISTTDPNISVSATATGGTGSYTYSWNFGDGVGTGTDQLATYVYASEGTYTITLTINDGVNSVDVVKDFTATSQPPLAGDFTITQTSPTDLNVGVSATATGGTGSYTYSWNFGDTGTGSDQATSHTYASEGTYPITLTINDGVNSVDVVKNVTISALPPLAGDFAITQASPTDLNVGVSATATGGTGTYTYSWTFGDGIGTGNGDVANYTYATSGTYPITLTINDGVNTVDVVKNVTITALPPLAGDFTISQVSPTDLNIGVSATATGGTGSYTYSWNFGDGIGTGSGDVANYAYATAGTYPITLTIGDGVNTVDVVKNVVIDAVQLPPLAGDFAITQASPTDLNVGVTVTTATGGTGSYTYSWNFGDGIGTGSGDVANYAYATAGTYPITLTIGDGVNTVDVVKNVVIDAVQLPPLTADFTITQASPTDLNISVTATVSGGTGAYTYLWAFGEGGSGFDATVNYTYASTGTYSITLSVGDGVNTVDVVKDVTIDAVQTPPPYAGTVPVLDNIPNLAPDLNPVYNNGQNAGLSSSAFAIVGDQTAADPNFLRTIFNLDPNTTNAVQLQATIDRFNSTSSFTRSSVAVGTLTAQDLLNITGNPSCNGAETLLQCEMRLANGSIAIVSVGYQDAVNGLDAATFEAQINQIIQQAVANNVIPVLMTIQPSTNPTVNDLINAYNEAIITSADSANVPIINTWRAMNELPAQGLGGGDTPSVDGNGAGYLSDVPTAGANARNYYTLVTLNDIVNTLFTP